MIIIDVRDSFSVSVPRRTCNISSFQIPRVYDVNCCDAMRRGGTLVIQITQQKKPKKTNKQIT